MLVIWCIIFGRVKEKVPDKGVSGTVQLGYFLWKKLPVKKGGIRDLSYGLAMVLCFSVVPLSICNM